LDFGNVLGAISGFLEEKGFRHAVIGGVALATYGLHRSTLDLDLVVESSAQDEIVRFLESLGYQTLHRSSGYSNHRHPDPRWGNIDFVYVAGETSRSLFEGLRTLPGPRGLRIPLPKPEHLVALKVVAMKNDPARRSQDMADIRFLLHLPGTDQQAVKAYFDRHGMSEQFDELGKNS
jgi:hypothetical protein